MQQPRERQSETLQMFKLGGGWINMAGISLRNIKLKNSPSELLE